MKSKLICLKSKRSLKASIEDINGCRISGNGKCHWQHIVLVAISFYLSSVSKPFLTHLQLPLLPYRDLDANNQLVDVIICNAPPSPKPACPPHCLIRPPSPLLSTVRATFGSCNQKIGGSILGITMVFCSLFMFIFCFLFVLLFSVLYALYA